MEQGKIGTKQAIMLMMSTVLPTAILSVPAITIKIARQDAWLSLLIATLVGLAISLMAVSLGLRFPDKTIFVYPEKILGRVAGKIVTGLNLWMYVIFCSAIVREYGFFLATSIMPETPIIVFSILLISVAAYAVRNGLEVLSRFNQLFIPVTGMLVIAFLLTTKDMKLTRLLPLFDTDLSSVLKGAFSPTTWLGEIVTITVFIPYLNKPKEAYRVAVIATLLNGFFLTASTMGALLIFGPDLTGNWVYPTFNVLRVVSVSQIVIRMESIVLILWLLGGIVKIGVFYYAAVLGSAQWLGLRDYKPLVAPLGLIIAAQSYIFFGNSTVDLRHSFTYAWNMNTLILFDVGIPLVLLIVALVRRKGGRLG